MSDGKDKESARQKAIQLFPDAHAMLARKGWHGRAEASLIALYGVERERQYGVEPVRSRDRQIDEHAPEPLRG